MKRELPRVGRRSPTPSQPQPLLSAWPRSEERHQKMTNKRRYQPNLREPAHTLGLCQELAGSTQWLSAHLQGSVCSSGIVPSGTPDRLRRPACSVSTVAPSHRRSTATATSQKFLWRDRLGGQKRPPPCGCIGPPTAARPLQHPSVRPGRSAYSRAAAISPRPRRERADRSLPFGGRCPFLRSGTPCCVPLRGGPRFARDC